MRPLCEHNIISIGISISISNNNCEGPNKSDEDSFDSDDGFCSVDDDESLFDKWEDEEDLDV